MTRAAAGWGEAQRVFDVLDAALTKGPWILGESFSAADIIVGAGLNFAVRLFKMVPSRPSFAAYIARGGARPPSQRPGFLAGGKKTKGKTGVIARLAGAIQYSEA